LNLLQGNKVKLRAPEPEDLEVLYLWENDTNIWNVSNTLVPFSRFTLRNYIESSRQDIYEIRQVRFMIDAVDENNVKTIGSIDIFDFDPYSLKAGIGILIGEESERGKGYADDSLKIVIRYCFTVLKLHQLYCNITTENKNSIQLFQKNGFLITGEKKDWVRSDNGWENEYILQLLESNKI
jgi:diamine N-acetyltransferase